MTKSTGAHRMAMSVGSDIKNDVVGAARTHASRNVVKIESMTNLPRDNVIRAGRVAAQTDGPDERAVFGVKSQAAAEYVHATDLMSHHRIVRLAVVFGVTAVRHTCVDGITVLQSVQAAAGLYRRIEICGGQRKSRQAECIRR